jgi:CubicO group peptidase (beta-lactamase class C family)
MTLFRVLAITATIAASTSGLIARQAGREALSEQRALDSAVERLFALDLTPGMTIAAVRGADVVFARGLGVLDVETRRPVTTDSIFYIASTTKSLTAFAAALLHHSKTIDLDGSLATYFPGLTLKPPLSAADITVRDLLTHTHGISNAGPITLRTAHTGDHSPALLLRLLSEYDPASRGRAFAYGNLGYNVAGMALEARLGKSWQEIVSDLVLRPLEMKDTSAYISRADRARLALPHAAAGAGYRQLRSKADSTMHAAGGHVTTARDLTRWIEAHLNRGRVDGRQVFPAAVVAETHRQHAAQDRMFNAFHRHGWGLGWDLGTYDGDTLVHRFGGFPGFRSHVSFMPDRGVGVIVLTNAGGAGSTLADAVATSVYDILLAKPELQRRLDSAVAETRASADRLREQQTRDLAERSARRQALPRLLGTYAGSYYNEAAGCLELQVARDRLRAKMGVAEGDIDVTDGPMNRVEVDLTGGPTVMTFAIEDGQARALTFEGHQFSKRSCP